MPNMKPYYCQVLFNLLILVVLVPTLDADSEDSECYPEIKVRRHTKYEAFLGKELRIKCPVTFCNISPPKVFWVKSAGAGAGFLNVSNDAHIRVEWETLRQYEGTSYLIFQSILENDAGVYRCEISDTLSHNINVYISGQGESSNSSLKNETRVKAKDTDSAPTFTEDVWIYVYCAAGISSFVIIVIIISIISMKGCKGKSKEAQTENQYMSIPMAEQRATLQPSPRGSPCVPPSQRSTKRKAPSRQPNELTSSRVNFQLYGQTEEDRNRQRHTVSVEESQSVVYAALN
ncbi:uncharacterized protein PAE49_012366 [Odontesthes bonariensis]|uniref:uncharacterized protein LOC142391729 n=1 Tax=Odontesthes bonariensis TaxID=219752 RepID=UPI003F583C37